MCPKTPKAPIFLIGGVCFVIVLVVITGITLINNINLSNIIRLNEKVASDSVSAGDSHMKEMNYGNQHPKNVFKLELDEETGEEEDQEGEHVEQTEEDEEGRPRSASSSSVAPAALSEQRASAVTGSEKLPKRVASSMTMMEEFIDSDNNNNKDDDDDDDYDGRILSPKIAAVVWNHHNNNNNNHNHNNDNNKKHENKAAAVESFTDISFQSTSSLKPSDTQELRITESPEFTTSTATNGTETESPMSVFLSPSLSLLESNESMIDSEKRQHVVKMMEHAWQNYKLYAWGKNELRPISQRPHSGSVFGSYELGATIVDGLDTLYLMGLDKEYKEGREWIERKLWLDNISADLSVFETNIRFVGGLLTLYAFTGDTMYRDRAQHFADKLLPAFQTPTGIPYALVNTRTGISKNFGWASGGSSILSEFGTLHLEFAYLSDITGNPLYRERVQAIRQVLKEIEKPKGLYPNFLNPKTGKWGQMHMSLGALGDSYFEYLLKAWLQSGQTDEEAREMFDEAMVAIIEKMVRTSPNGLTYVSDLKFDRLEHKMDHLACFSGGLFALGSQTRQNENTEKFLEIGKGITNTCHESYIRTPTKLGPEAFRFSEAAEARSLKSHEKHYILRPETIESYFILWRLTHDQKYRDWGWDAVQALERYCRTPHGYSGIKNVYQEEPQKDDVQQSFFLAETLKYLYLLFSDDSLLPLDEWVFNTEAHPLPIKGANIYYRAAPTTSAAAAVESAASNAAAAPATP